MASIQIEKELFVMLLQYHLNDETDLSEEIIQGLNDKLDKLISRELFTKYKRAGTSQEREQYRKEYLQHRMIHKDFISPKEMHNP